ncbi:MAG: bifunctional DNA primase/polymerase [Pseudomonadota bacterium]
MILLPCTQSRSLAEAAHAYSAHGWRVIMTGQRKIPMHKWKNVEVPSPETVRKAFELDYQALLDLGLDPNYAHVLGPNSQIALAVAVPKSIVVLDIDHRPERGWNATEIGAQLKTEFNLPACPVARSPSGGFHLYFSLPDGSEVRNWTSQDGKFPIKGVDVRTNGGVITVPPTSLKRGSYQWLRWLEAPPLAPDALVEDLRPPKLPENEIGEHCSFSGSTLDRYWERAFQSEISALVHCGVGGRNQQLFKTSAALASIVAGGGLPEVPVKNAILQAARANGLIESDGRSSVHATIRSGWSAGQTTPRKKPEGRND